MKHKTLHTNQPWNLSKGCDKQVTTFRERLVYGNEATDKTVNIFREQDIYCEQIISQERWDSVSSKEELKELQEYDKINGDLYISKRKFRCDVKRDKISWESLQKFQGDYFILWRMSLNECIVIKREDTMRVNRNSCIQLESGDMGYNFEQLLMLPYVTLDEFIKLIK